MARETTVVTVSLPNELADELAAKVTESDKSKSTIVKRALEMLFASDKPKPKARKGRAA